MIIFPYIVTIQYISFRSAFNVIVYFKIFHVIFEYFSDPLLSTGIYSIDFNRCGC